jgi:hypothetical protein
MCLSARLRILCAGVSFPKRSRASWFFVGVYRPRGAFGDTPPNPSASDGLSAGRVPERTGLDVVVGESEHGEVFRDVNASNKNQIFGLHVMLLLLRKSHPGLVVFREVSHERTTSPYVLTEGLMFCHKEGTRFFTGVERKAGPWIDHRLRGLSYVAPGLSESLTVLIPISPGQVDVADHAE